VLSYSETANKGIIQRFTTTDNKVWTRAYYYQTWSDWIGYTETGDNYFINTIIDKPFNLDSNSKVIAFGDSITAGYPVGADKVWVKLIADKIGFTLDNEAVSGARFDETIPNSIKAQYENVADWSNVTHVFVSAGINDSSNDTDITAFRTYVQNTVDYIKAHCNAKILFITPLERRDTQHNRIHYCSIINSVALENDCSVINGYDIPIPYRTTRFYNDMTTDTLHPNELGQKVYAKYVLSQIL
jgi:acyl-CoA hydrolase